VEEIDDNERKRFWGFIFLHDTKSSSFGELKNCIGGGFWRVLKGLYEFFKFNLCSYNILKIKNILIININLSFFKNLLFQKMKKILSFSPIFPFRSSPNSQIKLKVKQFSSRLVFPF